MFAKLFTTEDRGQLLVVRQTNDQGEPEVRAYCEPTGLGVSSAAVSWNDDEEGWDLQEACFGRCTEVEARALTNGIFLSAAEMDAEEAPDIPAPAGPVSSRIIPSSVSARIIPNADAIQDTEVASLCTRCRTYAAFCGHTKGDDGILFRHQDYARCPNCGNWPMRAIEPKSKPQEAPDA